MGPAFGCRELTLGKDGGRVAVMGHRRTNNWLLKGT